MMALDTRAFPTPSEGRTYWAAGYWSTDGLFYRTRPFRQTHAEALADARVVGESMGAQLRLSCDAQSELPL